MYLIDNFVDRALEGEWASNVHRQVAITLCISNPSVFSMDALANNVQIINKIPEDRIKLVTIKDIEKLGCIGCAGCDI